MNIKTYDNLSVTLLRHTGDPARLVAFAASHCMRNPEGLIEDASSCRPKSLVRYLLSAEHENPFEHVVFTFQVHGLSRSGMAQLTRHRHASYTFTSQHYQEYHEYPFIIHPEYTKHPEWDEAFTMAMHFYDKLLRAGVPKEEARQVLPNAMSTTCVMTFNARSLINFIRLRLCKRNCAEIINLARVLRLNVIAAFPELFDDVHTMCVMDGKCNQGAMSCGEPYKKA